MSKLGHANDAMIRRLQKELEERTAAAQGIVATAQDGERDLNKAERETLTGLRDRITELRTQLGELEATADLAGQVADRMKQFDQAITMARRNGDHETEYRSAGAWALDSYQAALGNVQARERLELFYRVAAHQKTPDNLGVIPDPVIGNVINFIDAARPIVSVIGPQSMPSATWHRPHVTQHTSVTVQGSAGAASDEKAELTSQKMTITRLNANAVTYGGYVNVSRQNIDFSSPQILDLIINDLAAQYAIQTEAATAAELAATTADAVGYGVTPSTTTVAAAIWTAVARVYSATKGQGRLVLAVAPDRLSVFGPLFTPVNPQNAQSTGFTAGMFGQGQMGAISGVPVVMSAGLGNGEAFLFSTAAIETFEQRVGSLQVIEPSVLGVQVAYAGYFTPLTIEDEGIVPLTATEPDES
jgi:HK97 family phage major capsid protein